MINHKSTTIKEQKQSIKEKESSAKITKFCQIKPSNSIKKPRNEIVAEKLISIKNEIDNLQSIYMTMALLNQKIDQTFIKQKEYSECKLHDKLVQIIELKEKNFKSFSKINSMANINNIDEYLSANYSCILKVCPKAENALENINDLVSNINYGIDRLFLNNLICDENTLKNTIQSTTKEINELNQHLNLKINQINEIKNNYTQLVSLIMNEKDKCDTATKEIKKYRAVFLGKNIDVIYQELSSNNKILMYQIVNDD